MKTTDSTPCPYCDSLQSVVIDTRREVDNAGILHIRRRRKCIHGHRYTTTSDERVIGKYRKPHPSTYVST